MPSASAPVGPALKFKGCIPYGFSFDQGRDEWGLTQQEQETYVEQFRATLERKHSWAKDQDYYLLRRFLQARSYDLEKATAMWMNNVAFRKEFSVDTILEDFVFEERVPFLEAYPQGYHKCDKLGRPVYIQLLGKVNVEAMKRVTSEQRMIKFHIQEYERCRKVILPVCSKLAGRNIDQTFGIMDVKGIGLLHLNGEVKRLLGMITKYDQDNYPEMLGHICVINAPWVFRMIWAVVRGYLDPRTQSKIEILDFNYLPALLKWVDKESLPVWLGGSSHGTLLEDVGPWSDGKLVATLGLKLEGRSHSQSKFYDSFAASVSSWKSWNLRFVPFVPFMSYIYYAASVNISDAYKVVMHVLGMFCFTNKPCHGAMAAESSSAQ